MGRLPTIWRKVKNKRLKKEYPWCENPRELASKLGVTYNALKSRVAVLKLKRKVGHPRTTICTKSDDRYIKKNYLKIPLKRIADNLGYYEVVVKTRMDQLGLVRPRHIVEKFIAEARIQPGTAPPNKGKKQSDYMSKEAIAKTLKTRFKKGGKPKNTKYDGAITIHTEITNQGRVVKYKWIRISEKNWVPLHRHNWIKKHGPVPRGHIIVFKNKDTMNCKVSNLRMISNAQHAAETRSKDGYIAMTMAHLPGKARIDRNLMKALLKRKGLIDLKRKQLQLKHILREQATAN